MFNALQSAGLIISCFVLYKLSLKVQQHHVERRRYAVALLRYDSILYVKSLMLK